MLVSVSIAVLFAGAASAGSTAHFYGELLTSDSAFFLPKDARVRVDLASEMNPYDTVKVGTIDYGAGLGNGDMPHGATATWTHKFEHAAEVSEIVKATLTVAVWDDRFGDYTLEEVQIEVDGEAFAAGSSRYMPIILHDTIAAYMFLDDDELEVAMYSSGGMTLGWSFFGVHYLSDGVSGTGGGVAPMPEPGGIALFYAGLVVFGTARQRMRSWRRG
jgi:hypothetical protein